MLSQSEALEAFRYEPETGKLYWSKKASWCVNIDQEVGWIDNVSGYRRVEYKGKSYQVHRIIFLIAHGFLPEQVDHINHERIDNRLENLRAADARENSMNRTKQSNNSSGINGVGFHKLTNKWRADIRINRKLINLGYFTDIEDAIKARKEAAVKYGFHKNHGT